MLAWIGMKPALRKVSKHLDFEQTCGKQINLSNLFPNSDEFVCPFEKEPPRERNPQNVYLWSSKNARQNDVYKVFNQNSNKKLIKKQSPILLKTTPTPFQTIHS